MPMTPIEARALGRHFEIGAEWQLAAVFYGFASDRGKEPVQLALKAESCERMAMMRSDR